MPSHKPVGRFRAKEQSGFTAQELMCASFLSFLPVPLHTSLSHLHSLPTTDRCCSRASDATYNP